MIHALLHEVPELAGKNCIAARLIAGGLSGDRKIYVETDDGQRLLLRVSGSDAIDRKRDEYEMTMTAYRHGVPAPQPLGFGSCEGGKSCYALFRWMDGKDAESMLPEMSEAAQYALGRKTGELLRKIHSIPSPSPAHVETHAVRFGRRVDAWIARYHSKPEAHCEAGDRTVRYLQKSCTAIAKRPQTFIHGDYNTENIIVMPTGEIGVIDFNSYNTSYGDPWEELTGMAWMPALHFAFHSGQINGYFGGEPPAAFWSALCYYLAYSALTALTDAEGLNGVDNGAEIAERIFAWTDNFTRPMPVWYG